MSGNDIPADDVRPSVSTRLTSQSALRLLALLRELSNRANGAAPPQDDGQPPPVEGAA